MDKPSAKRLAKPISKTISVLKLPPLLAATTANVVMIPSRPPKTKLFTYFPPAPACASSASYLISPSFVLLVLFPGVEFLARAVTVDAFALDSCAARDAATSFSLNASFAADNRRVKFILVSRVRVFMCVFMCVYCSEEVGCIY